MRKPRISTLQDIAEEPYTTPVPDTPEQVEIENSVENVDNELEGLENGGEDLGNELGDLENNDLKDLENNNDLNELGEIENQNGF